MDNAGLPPPPTFDDDKVARFKDFLENDTYRTEIENMLTEGRIRLSVNLDHVRAWDREFADGLMDQPLSYVPSFEKALQEHIKAIEHIPFKKPAHVPPSIVEKPPNFSVGFTGAFGANALTPRTLRSHHLGKLVALEGIITRASLVRPKIVTSVHYSPVNHTWHQRTYLDEVSAPSGVLPTAGGLYPKVDADDNPLETEFGLSTYRDFQRIGMQELPERAPAGQLPRSVEITCEEDLVDSVKPGDRVVVVGTYKSLGGGKGGGSASFKTILVANNIVGLNSKGGTFSLSPTVQITASDIRNINKVSKRKDVFDLLSQSLAPSIYGNEYVKRAVLLLLLGGMEKNLPNGTHIRGDINMLMVGDPSTAKSQMLRFVLNTAPLAIATTGRGSSGVGLTAAVTTDKETGERRLEAGAMVLADRGVVCIDEFDKMSEVDRVAIHEVMEQQTVTIAKAGIHTSLNARCSVIAAANPIYGQYDIHKDPHKNIALPDSLLSRFDLLFVMTDDVDEARDRMISEHVLRMHRYLQPGVAEGTPAVDSLEQNLSVGTEGDGRDTLSTQSDDTPVFEKYNPLVHGGVAGQTTRSGRVSRKREKKPEVLTIQFVKKYIQYAKTLIEPTLTQGAADWIVQVYSGLRNDALESNQRRTSPLTARTLETLIRLSTAHAKCRLSNQVEEQDAMAAEEILRFALFKEVVKQKKLKKRKLNTENAQEASGSEEEEEEEESQPQQQQQANGARIQTRKGRAADDSGVGLDSSVEARRATRSQSVLSRTQETQEEETQSQSQTQTDVHMETDGPIQVSDERFKQFRTLLGRFFKSTEDEDFSIENLLQNLNTSAGPAEQFRQEEAEVILQRLDTSGEVMFASGIVYKV
ncbi:MCM-domain-containing protein [Atractiella rhizophila]|nr:MCM-domain-containing protein [Atractiella rhizophila]